MVARLFLFLLEGGLFLSLPITAFYLVMRPRIRDWQEQRRQQLLGEQNARALLGVEQRRCRFCLEVCTEVDCYEPGKGWFHYKCLQALLG